MDSGPTVYLVTNVMHTIALAAHAMTAIIKDGIFGAEGMPPNTVGLALVLIVVATLRVHVPVVVQRCPEEEMVRTNA